MLQAAKLALGVWLGWVAAPFVLTFVIFLTLVAWAFFRVFVLEPLGVVRRSGGGR